jgi:small-conductance mechanosensitive channel
LTILNTNSMLQLVVFNSFLKNRGLGWVALVMALLLPVSAARAQEEAPVTLSEGQVNQIVEQVTGAVLKEMKAGQPPAAPVAPTPGETLEEGFAPYLQEKGFQFFEQFENTLRAYPALAGEIGSIISRVDGRPQGHGPVAFLGVVALIFAGAAALGYGTSWLARWLLPGTEATDGTATIGQILRRATASMIGFAAFWMVTVYTATRLFNGIGMQGTVGHWLLMGGAQFALFYTLFLIWFRPAEPAYRIVPLDDGDARLAMRLFATMLAIVVLRSWIAIPIANNQPAPVIAAGLLINNLLFVSSFFAAAIPARHAVRRWIENTAMGAGVSPLRRWLAANWLGLAGASVLLISAIHAYGAVTGHPGVVAALTATVRAVLLMILICALAEFIGRRSEPEGQTATRTFPKLPGLVSQMFRMFITLAAAVYFTRLWAVDALHVMTQAQWSRLAIYAVEPLAALFAIYMAITYVNYAAARYLAMQPKAATKVNEDGDIAPSPDGSSRLRTLIPILRISVNVLIAVMISLLVLSHLGFNITPLLAGASVIGLAISFGSQALVKDIVTGVLFLAEDSFRIGEYIVCGNSRGTVEGFTLRSVRLRHQDGQIFTVPFGQIGEIVNFSRDWSTVKFTMSLDRDADLEDVRRVTANVAAELKEDYRDRLLDPLKVQGVKDVTDTAIVVQFLFTALPRDPGEIERAARSRLLKAFRDAGISLARHPWLAPQAAQPA